MEMENKKPRGLSQLQKSYFSIFGKEGPKPIPPKLVRIYGYTLSAMISQLLFWKGMEMRKDGFIFKTEKDFIKELGASPAQQKLAIKKAKEFGFFEVVRKGIPAKRHYRLNYNLLLEVTRKEAARKKIVLIESNYKFGESGHYKQGEKNRTITNNTKENTAIYHKTESTADILAKKYKRR